jgi:hypothetical protein
VPSTFQRRRDAMMASIAWTNVPAKVGAFSRAL